MKRDRIVELCKNVIKYSQEYSDRRPSETKLLLLSFFDEGIIDEAVDVLCHRTPEEAAQQNLHGDSASVCPNYQGIGDEECYTCKHSPANSPSA